MRDERVDDRFELDLRAALRHEMATAKVGVAAPQVRGRIAARDRSRRTTRLVLLAAALLATLVAVPVVGALVRERLVTPPGAAEPATVAAIDPASGDLVLSRAWPDGRSEMVASYAGALELLREANASGLPDDAVATVGPSGSLAVGLPSGDTLVFTGRPDGGAFVSRALKASPFVTWIGWAPDGRLAIVDDRLIVRLVDPATARETTAALPERVRPESRFIGRASLLTWSDKGLVVAQRSDPATFRSELGVVDVTAERPAFVPGRPSAIRATTGVEPLEAADGSAPVVWSMETERGGTVSGLAAMGKGDSTSPHVGWYVAGRGEHIFDQVRSADHRGLLAVTGPADGSQGEPLEDGRLLLLDAPGAWRETFSFASTARATLRLVGVAPGGRAVVVATRAGLVVGDLASGATTTLPNGTVFVAWSRSPVVALDALPTLPPCEPMSPAIASTIALSEAGTTTPASSGALPVMGGRVATGTDTWRREELASVTPVTATAGGTLVLALPDGACIEAVSAQAVAVEDPEATTPVELVTRTAGGLTVGGLSDFAAPPAGEWIVRVQLWLVGPSAETILLYRVDTVPPTLPAASPSPLP